MYSSKRDYDLCVCGRENVCGAGRVAAAAAAAADAA